MTAITFGEICLQGFYSFEVKTIQNGCDKGNKIETQFLTVWKSFMKTEITDSS